MKNIDAPPFFLSPVEIIGGIVFLLIVVLIVVAAFLPVDWVCTDTCCYPQHENMTNSTPGFGGMWAKNCGYYNNSQ